MLTNGIKKDTRVLIIGAGIGGLALAQALRKQQIPYLVFERDAGVHARGQGWAIALHAYGSFLDDVEYSNISRSILGDLLQSTPNDLPPLQETAVTHGLGRGASYTSRAAFFDAYSGEKKMEIGGDLGDPKFFIRVTRSKLREWLRSHIDIQWNKCFVRYEESDHGVTAFFADGSSATGEMLVGCEGINSHGEPPSDFPSKPNRYSPSKQYGHNCSHPTHLSSIASAQARSSATPLSARLNMKHSLKMRARSTSSPVEASECSLGWSMWRRAKKLRGTTG